MRLKSLTNKELISRPLIAPTSEPNPKPTEVRQQSISKELDPKISEALNSSNSTSDDSTSNDSTSSGDTLTDFSLFGSTSSSSTSSNSTLSESTSSGATLIDFSLYGSTSSDSTSSPFTLEALHLSTELSVQPLVKSMTNIVIESKEKTDHQMITSPSKEPQSIASNQSEELVSNPVGRLQQICDNNGWPLPSYYTTREEGLPRMRVFIISCVIEKFDIIGTGVANTKRLAKGKAAQNMIECLKNGNQLKVVVRPLNSV